MKKAETLLDEIWKSRNRFVRKYRIRPDEIVLSEGDCLKLVGAFAGGAGPIEQDALGKVKLFGMKVLRSRDQDEGEFSFAY